MDIALAQQTLQTVITQKETELEILRLAKSILENSFEAEFENLESTEQSSK